MFSSKSSEFDAITKDQSDTQSNDECKLGPIQDLSLRIKRAKNLLKNAEHIHSENINAYQLNELKFQQKIDESVSNIAEQINLRGKKQAYDDLFQEKMQKLGKYNQTLKNKIIMYDNKIRALMNSERSSDNQEPREYKLENLKKSDLGELHAKLELIKANVLTLNKLINRENSNLTMLMKDHRQGLQKNLINMECRISKKLNEQIQEMLENKFEELENKIDNIVLRQPNTRSIASDHTINAQPNQLSTFNFEWLHHFKNRLNLLYDRIINDQHILLTNFAHVKNKVANIFTRCCKFKINFTVIVFLAIILAIVLAIVAIYLFIMVNFSRPDQLVKQKRFKYTLCSVIKLSVASAFDSILAGFNFIEESIYNYFSTSEHSSGSHLLSQFVFSPVESFYICVSKLIDDVFFE